MNIQKLNTFIEPTFQFAKAAAVVTITQIAIYFTRINDSQIRRSTSLTPERIKEIRRTLETSCSMLTVAYFYKSKNETVFNFFKKNPFLVATTILIVLNNNPRFFLILKKEKLNVNPLSPIYSLGDKLATFCGMIKKRFKIEENYSPTRYVYNHSVVTPVVEELFFRGVIQEVLLRQLPKLVLRSITRIPPELVDLPAVRYTRFALSAFLFAVAHLHSKKTWSRMSDVFLIGMQVAYLSENIKLPASILVHSGRSLYVSLAKS